MEYKCREIVRRDGSRTTVTVHNYAHTTKPKPSNNNPAALAAGQSATTIQPHYTHRPTAGAFGPKTTTTPPLTPNNPGALAPGHTTTHTPAAFAPGPHATYQTPNTTPAVPTPGPPHIPAASVPGSQPNNPSNSKPAAPAPGYHNQLQPHNPQQPIMRIGFKTTALSAPAAQSGPELAARVRGPGKRAPRKEGKGSAARKKMKQDLYIKRKKAAEEEETKSNQSRAIEPHPTTSERLPDNHRNDQFGCSG